MAAYHWEARRRQIIMEHRLRLMQESRISEESQQQVSKKSTQNSTVPLCSSMTSQNLPQKEIVHDRCLCQTDHVPSQSGKLLKRYTTTYNSGNNNTAGNRTEKCCSVTAAGQNATCLRCEVCQNVQ